MTFRDRIGDRRVVASISGGKDSAALSLWLTEQGIDHDRVAMDTGWEWRGWREYVEGPLAATIGPVKIIRAPETLAEMAERKGIFPSRLRRWCTERLKLYPMRDEIRARQDAGTDVLCAVGIRAEESAARAQMPEWEWSDAYDAEIWRPLLQWTEEDVIAIHHRHGLRPNPLYLIGARRVGCWPCIMAGRDEIRLVAEKDPTRIDEIRALEARVTDSARKKVAERGEELASGRTFFREREAGQAWPIDRAVEWARRLRPGERQIELFAPRPEDAGCMRWGLCETAGAER